MRRASSCLCTLLLTLLLLPVAAYAQRLTLSGIYGISAGGTGATTFTAGVMISPGGTTALSSIANVAAGQVLVSGTPAVWSATPSITTLAISAGTTQAALSITGTNNPEILLQNGGATKLEIGIPTLAGNYITGSAANDVIFRQTGGQKILFSTSATGATNDLTLSAGNVGIGTTGPGDLLEVEKNQNTGTLIRVDNPDNIGAGAYSGMTFYQGATQRAIVSSINDGFSSATGGAAAMQIWNFSNGNMVFGTNATERLRITNAGNVGIGTTTFGTSAVGVLALGTATAPTTSPADIVQMWGADIAGAGTFGLNIRDEGGFVYTLGNGSVGLGVASAGVYTQGFEMTAPAAPAADGYRLYAEDNGAGKTRYMIRFATGAAVQITIEP